jgi:hypothetical protein
MKKLSSRKTNKEYLSIYRERKLASGGHLINVYLPANLVELLDQSKEAHGARGRAPIIIKALETYFRNNNQGA